MKYRIAGILAAVVFAFFLMRPQKRFHQPIVQEAYIWQRDWTPAVCEGVLQQQSQFHQLVVLAAEISFRNSPGNVIEIHPNYAAIAGSVHEIGIAIRVGPMSGSAGYEPGSSQTKLLCETAVNAMNAARAAGFSVAEIQIDFDCAESKLGGYRNWIAAVKSVVAPVPVAITALPSWLQHYSFSDLAKTAGSFVIQVHSLHQPAGVNSNLEICNPIEAQQAVIDAAKLGVPFRVALPTYSYLAGFSSEGKFLGLSAEGPAPGWPQMRWMRSDPAQIAPLVASWIANPPSNMTGIIWYRLPVVGDSMNWSGVTLQAVMAGRVPHANVLVETVHSKPGLLDIYLKNTGDADATAPQSVSIQSSAEITFSEGIAGFDRLDDPRGGVIFRDSFSDGRRIAPGEKIQIGWLRLSSDKEVQAHVIASP